MKIRFLRPYFMYAKGEIIEPDKPVRDIMLARGLCEIVEGEKPDKKKAAPLMEVASIEPTERAVARGPGRPRKI
jgi:hypothetical protein